VGEDEEEEDDSLEQIESEVDVIEENGDLDSENKQGEVEQEYGDEDKKEKIARCAYRNTGIPNILLAGTQKGGTTSIAYHMITDPSICISDPKHALIDVYKHCGNATNTILMDATPETMLKPKKVEQICKSHGHGPPNKITYHDSPGTCLARNKLVPSSTPICGRQG